MHIATVTLSDMLDAREARSVKQAGLTAAYGLPLICFTMNMAGSVKDTPAVRYAFAEGLHALLLHLGRPVYQSVEHGRAGPVAYLVYALPAEELKAAAMQLENTPVGRLYDVDVLDAAGGKLSRSQPRRCLVCGEPAAACARSRAHGLSAIVDRTRELLQSFCADSLALRAVRALLDEVHLTPKPGLVDENNTGAHADMDLPMFERSAQALLPYFARAFRIGAALDTGFSDLHRCGLEAETAMFAATGGVNTHKGAIYGFLLLLAAFGRASWQGGDVFDHVRAWCGLDTRARKDGTHGTDGYVRYGAAGARGEAVAGFPHAREACRLLREADVWDALLYLLAEMDDTNVLHRGGADALCFLHETAAGARDLTGGARLTALRELDAACILRHISPGGCADMLAMALFLNASRSFWQSEKQAVQRQPAFDALGL